MEQTFTATLDDLEAMRDLVCRYARGLHFSREQLFQIELAVEEALVNICCYAYPKGQPGSVSVVCETIADKTMQITIRDTGIPFDPVAKLQNFNPDDLRLRGAEGGYGIYLMRNMVDQVQYVREGNTNILTLTKYNPQEALRN